MAVSAFLFWFLAVLILCGSIGVLLWPNPIYSALSLALTLVGVAGIFAMLNAYLLAVIQIIVYAGAVLVLFVMVLMIFDLRTESKKTFTRGLVSSFVKISSVAMLSGLVVGSVLMSAEAVWNDLGRLDGVGVTQQLSKLLFSKYLLEFEIMGILLLIIAVGTVTLARSKGGTHEP